MRAWRIYPRRFQETAFTGAGGLYVASRWNHLGTALVYTATSRSLAILEYFVNLDIREQPDDLLMAEASFGDESIETIDPGQLPPDWNSIDNLACRDLGSAWAASRRSLALLVPSIVVPRESNLLLNPAHPDFSTIALAEPIPFRFAPRMFR